ncbi:unnamed protein product [Trichobilharzia szidati]|nr:unnamed protein product [Trichobilharzia szidati]
MKPVPIQIPECQNTFYNYTGMPNLVGQETQFDARHQLQTFKPLITYKCSSKLNFFLCSVYTPMCDVNTHYLIGPCRPLCEHVRARCAPVLRVFDFDWPENLNCSRFPVKNSVGGAMCMEGPEDLDEDNDNNNINNQDTPQNSMTNNQLKANGNNPVVYQNLPLDPSVKEVLHAISLDANHKMPNHVEGIKEEEREGVEADEERVRFSKLMETLTSGDLPSTITGTNDLLPHTFNSQLAKYPIPLSHLAQSIRYCSHLKKPTFYVYINRTGRCAPLCEADILYTTEAKTLSTMWTSVLAGICSLVTTFTLVRYAMNPCDFRPNEKPIVYIALCQLFFALGYGLSLGLGRETVTCGRDLDSGRKIRLQEGLDNAMCAFVFMIQYFFSIASYIWWTMLVFHWALQRSGMIFSCLCCSAGSSSSTPPIPLQSQPPVPVVPSATGSNPCEMNIKPDDSKFTSGCFKWNCFCSCPENAVNSSKSEIITNEGLVQNNPPLTTAATQNDPTKRDRYCYYHYHHQQNHHNQYWSTMNSNHQRYGMFTPKTDQITACLAREHVVAWLTAGLFTVGVLVSRQVDADELIPVCGVGRQNTSVLGAFILAPQTVLITLGGIAFIFGFICLFPCFRHRKCFYWRQFKTKPVNMHTPPTATATTAPGHCSNQQSYPQSYYPLHQQKGQQSETDHQLSSMEDCVNTTSTPQTRSSLKKAKTTGRSHCQPTAYINNPSVPHQSNNKQVSSQQCFYQNYNHLCYASGRSSPSPGDPMEFRIGLFCFLYLIPLICMNACDLYEYLYRDKWLTAPGHTAANSNSNRRGAIDSSSSHPSHKSYGLKYPTENVNLAAYLWNVDEVYGPNPELFMLRIFMSLVTGFTCSLWMWTVKGCNLSQECCCCCLCLTNNHHPSVLKQKKQQESLNLSKRNSNPHGGVKHNYLSSSNDNNAINNDPMHKPTFSRTPEGTTYTLHPYAVYQYTKSSDGYSLQRPSVEGQLDLRRGGIVGCSNPTTTGCPTDINLSCNQKPNYPTTSILTKGHLSQLDTSFIPRDLEHSTATTPGYYSHAKISPNMIIDSMSEDASASSIPPPLPPANSRPPRLPARGDPCIGASASQVFAFTNKLNTEKLDSSSKTCQNHNNNNNNNNSSETENYSLIKFQVT